LIPTANCNVIFNKSDLPCKWLDKDIKKLCGECRFMEVSAKTGKGIIELRGFIIENILGAKDCLLDGILVTNLRHCHALENAEKHLKNALVTLKHRLSEEFVLVDLHKGLQFLGEITGETHIDDLLTAIFSKFCIGK
jgi:tRNA modification GTPase